MERPEIWNYQHPRIYRLPLNRDTKLSRGKRAQQTKLSQVLGAKSHTNIFLKTAIPRLRSQ